MMKKAILLLLLASFSFAKPPIPPPDLNTPAGLVFLNSMCMYNQLTFLIYQAESTYWVYTGDFCVNPDLKDHDSAILEAFYGDGSPGLVYLYQTVLWDCEAGYNTPECYRALMAYYPAARDARQVFYAAKTAYLLSAMQAISANNAGLCKNNVPDIAADIADSSHSYHLCMQGAPA